MSEDEPHVDVEGVETDPDHTGRTIAVDTNERLEKKDTDLDDVPEEQLERERHERLAPANRPDNTEVDNSDRDFDPSTGLFEDTDLEPPDGAPFEDETAEG